MGNSSLNPFVLINPKSGARRGKDLIQYLKKNYPEIPFDIPASKEAFVASLTKYGKSYETILIAGGDGTINQALPYFMENPGKKMAIFPTGSGNGFAMEMGFTNHFDSLLSDIRKGNTDFIDVIQLNGHVACNMSGIGLDGFIADLFLHQEKRGLYKYIRLTLRALVNFKAFKAKITIGKKEYHGEFLSLVFANTRQFGNGAYIAPEANPKDGKMNIILVYKMPFLKMLSFFVKLFMGRLKSHSHVQMMETSEYVTVHSSFSFAHVDGEPFQATENINVEIIPRAIQIVQTKQLNKSV